MELLAQRLLTWLSSLPPRTQYLSVQSLGYWLKVDQKRKQEGKEY